MYNPNLMSDYARIREEEYRREAEAERWYQQLKGNQPGLLQRLGHHLLAAGQRLRAEAQRPSATPVFNKK